MAEPNRQSGENEERIIEIEIERLRPFKEHPFQVKDDKEMFLLQESIEKYGILNPLIVRPVPDGYYEIISGHRRKHAAEKLGYRKVPVIIRVLSEDDSILSMVDSNLHRERISYSEKAFAYKLKNDVLKRKSGRKKSQVDHKTPRKRAIEIISEDCGDSPKQVQRYVMISSFLSEEEKMIVAAHELGHIILHRSQLKMAPMQDDTLYNMTDNTEYQANLFAADLLIDDEEIEDMVQNEDLDYFGLCSSLNATPELMSFKLYSLTKRGQAYHMPMEIQSNFLAK